MILIVGSGGNGQTYFMDFLQKNKFETNHIYDTDGLKHLSSPDLISKEYKQYKKKIKKCIFLYNHPYVSLLSHYRRGWPETQIKKLGNPYNLTRDEIKNYEKFKNKTIEKQTELFGIEYQFDNWINATASVSFPILFLNFNELLQKTAIVDLFLERPLNYCLFNYKERNCELDDSEMCSIYKKVYNKMQTSVLKISHHEIFNNILLKK